jgi:predicted flap endonuclease-1-like 5' DNA nuclease
MPRRVGRPGLIGTMARTAAITGTATAVNRSMTQRAGAREQQAMDAAAYQAQLAAPPAPAPAPVPAPAAPPAGGGDDLTAKLVQLAQLHDAGVLTDEEFAAAKAQLLS